MKKLIFMLLLLSVTPAFAGKKAGVGAPAEPCYPSYNIGDTYTQTDAAPGQNLWVCSSSTAAASWIQQTGGTTFSACAYPSLQAAINATQSATNATLDMSCMTSTQHIASQLTISSPLRIQGCAVTLSEEMTDPGQSSGGILITSDNVTISGIVGNNRLCTITRSNGANVQNQIYTGAHNNISIEWLTIDGNEDNQTYANSSTTYYTGWRTSSLGGGTNLNFNHNYVTRAGARALDWRGVVNTHADFNTIVDTGWNIGGSNQSRGNSFSIDIGYNNPTIVPSTDNWCMNNYDSCHGDSFRCGNLRAHVLGNHIYGCVTEGKTPWYTETGIDAYGLIDSEISGNYVTNTFNNAMSLNDYLILGTEYTPARDVVSNNDIYCDTSVNVTPFGGSSPKATCMLSIGASGNGTTLSNISVIGNRITGAPFTFDNIAGLTQIGNTHNGNVVNTYTLDPSLEFMSGAHMSNFLVKGDLFDNTTGAGLKIASTVTSPSPCKLQDNNFTATVTTTINYGVGGSATLCDVAGAITTVSPTTINQYSTDNISATVNFQKARGTAGSPTAVVANDNLGRVNFYGWDGAAFTVAGTWVCYPIGTISSGIVPGQCKFSVNDSSGVSTLVSSFDPTAFRIYSQLNVFNAAATFAHRFTSNATATRTITLPDANSNSIVGIANPSDAKAVNYVGTDGVQNRISVPSTIPLIFFCTGTATSNVTIDMTPGQSATTACSSTSTLGQPMAAHTFSGLRCQASSAGINADSGIVTVYDAGSTTALTCTIGTGTTCNDTTHSFTSAAGDAIGIRFATHSTGETLASVHCAVEVL